MIYKIGKGKSHIMTHCSDLVAEMVPITKVVSLYQVAILCGLDFRLNFVTFREKDLVSLVRSYRGLESPCDGFLWYCCNYSWSKPGKLGKLWGGGKPPNGRLLGVNGARENPERLSHLTHIPLCQAFTLFYTFTLFFKLFHTFYFESHTSLYAKLLHFPVTHNLRSYCTIRG